MKKLLSAALILFMPLVVHAGVHVQQNDASVTVGSMTLTTTSGAGGGLKFPDGTVQVTAGGAGGASSLQVSRSGVQITSPTSSMNFYSGDFNIGSVGSTATLVLNPNTTNFISNTSSLQSGATFYVSSGTVSGTLSANAISITGLSPGQCLQTGSGGNIGGTGVTCGTGNGAGGYAVQPATVTFQLNVGVTASTLTVTSTSTLSYTTINGAVPILSTSTLQSGATFYVSSGTVDGTFYTNSNVEARGKSVYLGTSAGTAFQLQSKTSTLNSCTINGIITGGCNNVAPQVIISTWSAGPNAQMFLDSGGRLSVGNQLGPNTLNVEGTASIGPSGGSYATTGISQLQIIGNTSATNSLLVSTASIGGNTVSITTQSQIIISGPNNGNIQLTISGSTYSVTSTSNTGSNVTVGHIAVFASTNATLTDGGLAGGGGSGTVNTGIVGNLAYYASNGTAVSGSTLTVITVSSITVINSSFSLTSNGIQSNSGGPAFFDIYNSGAFNGQHLFMVGSAGGAIDLDLQDRQPLLLQNYGVWAGGLKVGNAATPQQIQSQSRANYWLANNVSTMTFNTDNDIGGGDMVFQPQNAEAFRISKLTGIKITGNSTPTYSFQASTYTASFHVAVSTIGDIVTNSSNTTMGTCGTSPSVIGDNNEGIITVGGGVVTACTMNFAQGGWGAGCNVVCGESDNSTSVTGDISALSSTSVTFSFSATLGGGLVYYQCRGYGSSCR